MAHWLYVLRCGDGTLYTGYTTDVSARIGAHAAGRGARYTRGRGPLILAAAWIYPDKRTALQAEYRFKQLARSVKLRWLGEATVDPVTHP
ncbi:MAG: GIY-YIG nuclease family protein [Candidatus Sericytochromatia bacterium]|nr:GIY-YIG nuclease family protein [Candidatus Sericytochromatia bacterium]